MNVPRDTTGDTGTPRPASGRIPELDRIADREMALRARREAFVFVPGILSLSFTTDLLQAALWLSLGMGGLYLVAGFLRWRMLHVFDATYDRSPGRWRMRYAVVTLLPAVLWGGLLPVLYLKMSTDWTFLICLLVTVAVAFGSVSSLSPRLRILRMFVSLVLLPAAVTLIVAGRDHHAGLGFLLALCWLQSLVLAKYFHFEFWTSLRGRLLLRERAADLAAANSRVIAADKAKSDFLANMSHEIRTPMNSIIGMTDLVLDTDLTPSQREYLHDVHLSGATLLKVINEILDFSKIEAGHLELESVPFGLKKLIDGAVKPHLAAAAACGNDLQCELDPELPDYLVGDAQRLWQVLTNLLGNALKFTRDGTITLRVSQQGLRCGTPMVSFSVVDTGIGIPAEKQITIFDAFRQADGSTTRNFGGTGLGLTISSRIVQAMGGALTLVSTPGHGATFTAIVPLAAAAPEAVSHLASATGEQPAVDVTGTRVLLVEDNPVNAKLATRLLEKMGTTWAHATNGREAVDAWAEGDFEIILMDVQMPVMDGFQATAEIRDRETDGTHVPIIALTAHAVESYRQKCLTAGMDDYLSKPMKAVELRDMVGRWRPVPV